MNEKVQAFASLRKATELGYSNWDWIARDTDLTCLHEDPDFDRLIQEGRAKN
jgi:hypothetical protein